MLALLECNVEMETGRIDQHRLPVGSGYRSDRVEIFDRPVRLRKKKIEKPAKISFSWPFLPKNLSCFGQFLSKILIYSIFSLKIFLKLIINNYPVSISLFCLSPSFVYRSKINKQGCGLARKGHGNGVNVSFSCF